jgi:hypothetical protein
MSFTKKDCEKVKEIYEMTLEKSTLVAEEVECAAKFTVADLIVHAGFTLVEAQQFVKFIELERRRHERVGFKVVKESKESIFLKECNEMCRMAGVADEDYHPVENDFDGLRFEDHGAGEQAGMIKSNLQSIASKAQSLHDIIGDMDELPEWVQEKIAVADEMIDTINDYLKYEYGRTK